MKKVLILGASGFIGRNLAEYFSGKHDLFAPTSQELNVLDAGVLKNYITAQSFDVVLNALDRRMDISTAYGSSIYTVERLRMFENLACLSDYYGKMLYFGSGAE